MNDNFNSRLENLEDNIGYHFKNKKLLSLALTHSSYANEHDIESNERLEFLGDAVLELSISEVLYNTISLDEGVLTKMRAKVVCESALDLYAEKIELNSFILLGKGEVLTGGRTRPAIIADAFEALLGAIYLDGGLDNVKKIINNYIVPNMNNVLMNKDYKSILQEKLQAEKRTIRYEIVREEGPANNKTFEAIVYMDEILMGRGIGKTKKEAQQQAAKSALEKEAKL